jgi:hypothetical protein
MAVSGKAGTVLVGASPVTEVTKWTFEGSAQVHKYASNTTSGHKAAVAGVRDGKGTIETKVASDVIWTAGQAVTLVLQGPTSGDTITVPAIIATTPVDCDINDGNIISATYTFEANGAWTGAGIFAGID